jgi:dihydrolipoamide dehydrogenase
VADTQHFDLLVIGSGPGGYIGAIRAAQLGMKVACVERDKLGGVCLNWGCIPSKALLHNAEIYEEAVTHGAEWGIKADKASLDFAQVIKRSREVVVKQNKGVAFLFKKNNVTLLEGHARIKSGKSPHGPCKVDICEPTGDYYTGQAGKVKQTVTADRVLIASGAAPRELNNAPFDGKQIISSKHAMSLEKQPKSMVIVGSGAIGIEYAYFYNAIGTEVTVIELLESILPVEDDDVSKAAQRTFSKKGITFHLGHTVKKVEKKKNGVTVTAVSAKDESKSLKIDADCVLVAIGVQARLHDMFDPSLKPEMVKGYIKTDYRDKPEPSYQTSIPGVYAIGDVIGPPWLAHKASEEAVTCVERMAKHHTLGVDYKAIPGCTYCRPQVGSIGLPERDVKAAGTKYRVGKFNMMASGKATAVGATDGFVKLIVAELYGEILGCHIFGEDASELIHEIALAMRLEATAEDIISTLHAHPTMAEAIHEAALATENRTLNA